ncbi:MAG: hypothetical protein P8Y58_12120 [Novosphingobium sp.]
MSEAVDKLRIMLRVRGHQRDRLERAVIEERRENERRQAEHARQCDAVAKACDSHEAALFFRARNPGDALVSDYLITQKSRLSDRIRHRPPRRLAPRRPQAGTRAAGQPADGQDADMTWTIAPAARHSPSPSHNAAWPQPQPALQPQPAPQDAERLNGFQEALQRQVPGKRKEKRRSEPDTASLPSSCERPAAQQIPSSPADGAARTGPPSDARKRAAKTGTGDETPCGGIAPGEAHTGAHTGSAMRTMSPVSVPSGVNCELTAQFAERLHLQQASSRQSQIHLDPRIYGIPKIVVAGSTDTGGLSIAYDTQGRDPQDDQETANREKALRLRLEARGLVIARLGPLRLQVEGIALGAQ